MSMMPGAGGRAVSGRGTGWWPRSPSPSPGRGRCVAPMEVPLRSCLPGGSSRRDPGADTVRGQRPRCPPLSATGGGPLRVGRRPNAIMPPCASPGPAAAHYARRVAPRPPRQDRPWSLGPLITARTGPWILWPLLLVCNVAVRWAVVEARAPAGTARCVVGQGGCEDKRGCFGEGKESWWERSRGV